MYSRIREHFGPTALILSIVAIVFAMLGGAYAASSNGGEATASAKGKQGPPGPRGKTGKTGKTGAPGVAGPVGPQGPAGANGKDGANGQNGSPGEEGEPGFSVEVEPAPITACEERGGTLVRVEGEGEVGEGEEVCNGAQGAPGPQGEPWTAGGVLPPGKTETGTWSFTGNEDTGDMLASISFPIPLSGVLGEEAVHFWGETGFEEACPSTTIPHPEATPGALCVYYNENDQDALFNATLAGIHNGTDLENLGAARSGAILSFEFAGATGEIAHGFGTWAVTAPAAP